KLALASACVAPNFSARRSASATRLFSSSMASPSAAGVGRSTMLTISTRPVRAADGQTVDAQRRLTHAHRHGLALLAADADAGIELQVVADHAHPVQHRRAVADQRRVADR